MKYIEGYDEERDIEFNQTLIVTFSLKYRNYLQRKRESQIQGAIAAINGNQSVLEKKNQHDYRRSVKQEVKGGKGKNLKLVYTLNEEAILKEKKYDGFYAVETNLDDDVSQILKINHGWWKIEEFFEIMKDDFRSRPAYLSRGDRLKAHFMTCFMALQALVRCS